MILVDSSVWIDYLSPRPSPAKDKLDAIIKPNSYVAITGIIFQEILQGIKDPKSSELTQQFLRWFPFFFPDVATHAQAAQIFGKLASNGKICSSIDVLIAALAIQNKALLFTLDADFQIIQQYSDLKLFS